MLSRAFFGQAHRLAIMVAIARSDGVVNPTDLASDLGKAQSALQAPLKDLLVAGLIRPTRGDGRRNYYQRVPSPVWDAALWLDEQASERERLATARLEDRAVVGLRSGRSQRPKLQPTNPSNRG